MPPIVFLAFVQFRRGLYAAHWVRRVQTPGTIVRPNARTKTPHPVRPPLDDATRDTILRKAQRVARLAGLTASDIPDIEQDISIHVWRRLHRFDHTKSDDRGKFIRMLVAHATATSIRDRARRVRHAPESLEVALRRAGHEIPEPIDPRASRCLHEKALALDMETVLATLPRKLGRVAQSLRTRSIAATARHLRLSRSEVYRRLGELREAFVEAGLDKNL